MLPRGPLSGQGLLAPNLSVCQTGPRTEGYLEGDGCSGFEGSGNSLDSGLFGILAKKHLLYIYTREVRETEADTEGTSGRYSLAGGINVHPLRV